jgi:hypothetical protein
MNWILLNIPLGLVMVAVTVGLPLWVMLRFPEDDPQARTAARSHRVAPPPLASDEPVRGTVRELATVS